MYMHTYTHACMYAVYIYTYMYTYMYVSASLFVLHKLYHILHSKRIPKPQARHTLPQGREAALAWVA